MNKILSAVLFCLLAHAAAVAVEITGTVPVNVTSDTAASAKNKAFNYARREVISRELAQYADTKQLDAALAASTNEELMDIIASSSLDGEKVSDTTYSANVSFLIDGDAARRWMEKHSVQNWLPSSDAPVVVVPEDSVLILAQLSRPMDDWSSLNAIARSVKVDVATKKIVGNNVSFTATEKDFSKLSGALRANGWTVQKQETGYKIWK